MSKVENTAHRKAKDLRAKYLFNGLPTCELCGVTKEIIGHHCAGRTGRNANNWVNIQLRCEHDERLMHYRSLSGNNDRSIQIQNINNAHIRLKMEA